MIKVFIFICQSLNLVFGLNIGLLIPENSPSPGFPDYYSTRGVIDLARQEIWNRYKLSVSINWKDTNCDEGLAMVRAYELVMKARPTATADVLLGPVCSNSK